MGTGSYSTEYCPFPSLRLLPHLCGFQLTANFVCCRMCSVKLNITCELFSSCLLFPAAEALQNAAQTIDNAGESCPEAMAVANELRSYAHEMDKVANEKISRVQNRLSFDVFRDAVTSVLQRFPELKVKQQVMAVYHVGANFFLREERSQGPGTQGTIQSWPEQYFRESRGIREAMEKEGGLVSRCLYPT